MIDEEKTFQRFGYHSWDLSPQSNKRVVAVCTACGKVREIFRFCDHDLCIVCANRTKDRRKKLSDSLKGREFSAETRKRIGDAARGEKSVWYGRHHTAETKQKMREARKHQKMPTHHTSIELIFGAFAEKFSIGAEYTGDSKFWIGRVNPDYIIRDMRIGIFINGDYWHSPLLRYNIRDTQRVDFQIAECKKHKWKAIIIWGSDLKRKDAEQFVLAKLRQEGVLS